MSSRQVVEFQKLVVNHWRTSGRHELPWRKTKNPYKVLVSEIMLQQTQVERVIPYYQRFLKRFPTVSELAGADLTEVLRLWSGLGYNRRAKFLQEAVKVVVEKFNGKFPRRYEELRKLPGVGDYTARAVRAFAYSEPEVFIETNIRTVFTHHFFPDAQSIADSELMPLIETTAKGQSSREWYWALMDYGAHLKRSGIRINRRSKQYTKQSTFQGSLRQVRGAILKAHLNKKQLRNVKKQFGKRYNVALAALKKEGLIE